MSQAYLEAYRKWLDDTSINPEDHAALVALKEDEKDLEDRFYKQLEFGTAGLRGKIGLGINRMNAYTVGMAAQGFANYIVKVNQNSAGVDGAKGLKVVIAHDSRRMSREFCIETARVMAANGITAYIFDSLRSTPELSFAVRHMDADGGVVITASHNPPEYNGFKVYGADGAQLVPEHADMVTAEVDAVAAAGLQSVVRMSAEEAFENRMIVVLDPSVDEAYQQAVISALQHTELIRTHGKHVKALFTPLHGTGGRPVVEVLKRLGVENLKTVEEQMVPDSEFSTVKLPNPEEFDAFKLALSYAEGMDVDLIVGTDPDADRVGLVIKTKEGKWEALSGNQTGALLTDYVLRRYSLPQDPCIISTIVTSGIAKAICDKNGVDYMETLTGFKFIGEKIREFESAGAQRFIFGYEESYGYLLGTHARDKDAVVTTALIFEMMADYRDKGITIEEALDNLYATYGCYREALKSINLEGKEGLERIKGIMGQFRTQPPSTLAGLAIAKSIDYANDETGLRKSDVVKFYLEDGSWVAARPSGTEPKLKIYLSVKGENGPSAESRVKAIMKDIEGYLSL